MTDRELLELAAKAAGFQLDELSGRVIRRESDGQPVYWNPLTDDGDALRLMVRLRLHSRNFSPLDDDFDSVPMGMVEVWQEGGEDPLHIEYFKRGDDRLIVTRRAIVRAAAEIGRTRP